MHKVRPVLAADLSAVSRLGLDKVKVLRAMAQDMAWLVDDGAVQAALTARLSEGCLFVDGLVGQDDHRLLLIDHAIDYGKWSFAPVITIINRAHPNLVEQRGFVALDQERLPQNLATAAKGETLLMKRL